MIDRTALVIYHNPCLDGFSAAWAAKQALGNTAEYVPGNYADDGELPDVDNRIVYLLDFSYPRETMLELVRRAETVIVLDHHISAQKDLEDLLDNYTIEGEFDMDRSGAMITWNWFFPDQDAPEFIEYVQDRDIWKKELPNCDEVNLALFAYDLTFENWDEIASTPIPTLVDDGTAIHRKHTKDVRELAANPQYMTIRGFENIPTINANAMFGSDLGAILCKGQPFAAYYFIDANGTYNFGLRSDAKSEDSVDVSIIAKSYGGGGHANAAGFRIKDLNEL